MTEVRRREADGSEEGRGVVKEGGQGCRREKEGGGGSCRLWKYGFRLSLVMVIYIL